MAFFSTKLMRPFLLLVEGIALAAVAAILFETLAVRIRLGQVLDLALAGLGTALNFSII